MPGVAPVILVDSSSVPVSAEVVDRGFEVSSELDAEISTITSRISSLHRPESPATAVMSVQQVVVVSPTSYEASEVSLDLSSVANQAGSQEWYILSVQLSPNRVNKDFDYGTRDVFPVFPVSPDNDVYVPCVSPVSMPDSPAAPTLGSLLDEATGSYGSIRGSPVTSLSITDQAEHLQLLSEPLIPLPVVVLPDDAPERGTAPEVVPPPAAFSREGPSQRGLKQQPPGTTR